MLTMMSVKEILQMSAELRLPHAMPKEEKTKIVHTVIDVLGLSGKKKRISGMVNDFLPLETVVHDHEKI